MTSRCCLCGEFDSEAKTVVLEAGEACTDCLTGLVEDAIERRIERSQELGPSVRYEDTSMYRDSMIDAGRGHLVR